MKPGVDAVEKLPAATQEFPLEKPELYEGRVVPGSLFLLQRNMEVVKPMRGYKAPPVPYIQESWYTQATGAAYGINVIPRDTIAIYAGTLRVEEANRAGLSIRALRHAFIIDGLRYITLNLNCFLPVS